MGVSVKQGRVPSLAGAIFGILWTIAAISMSIFIIWLFGTKLGFAGVGILPFVIISLVMVFGGIAFTAMGFYNAFARNRISSVDIMTHEEEPDPGRHLVFNKQSKDTDPDELRPPPTSSRKRTDAPGGKGGYCPYCGAKAKADYEFCRKCGKDI
jgi:hypothetical protein